MRTWIRTAAALAAALLMMPAAMEAQKRQRDRITSEEIMASGKKSFDLYQVIQELRPRFLQPPPGTRSFGNSRAGSTPIAVFVDRKRDSGLDVLRTLHPSMVEEVRYLDPDKASDEYGPSAAGGAILVRLKSSNREKEKN